MKTKLFLTIVTIVFGMIMHAQSPNWLWAKRSVSASNANGNGITSDASGNIYVTGNFMAQTITFGSTTLTNDTTNGSDDIFVVKYDVNGNVVWAKSAGGSFHDDGYKIAVDTSGNVYVVGYYESRQIVFGNDTLVHAGGISNNDVFILKYDASGNPVWGRSAGGPDYEGAYGVAIDNAGNVCVLGVFNDSTITFGSFTLSGASNSNSDIFLVKYDASGNVLWANSAGGSSTDFGSGIATDTSGNIIITGSFISTFAVFGTDTLYCNSPGNPDIFTVKYNPSGNVLWAKNIVGFCCEAGQSVATDSGGNIYVAGYFQTPTITFGSSTLVNTSTSGSSTDVFILKYDSSGNPIWAESMGGSDNENATGISLDANGNSYVTGFFGSPSFISGTDTLINVNSSNSISDIFVAKYDVSGNPLWAKSVGGADYDYGNDITVDPNGYVSVVGNFQSSSIVFGTTTLPNSTVGSADVFTARLDKCASITPNICMVTVDSLSQHNIIVWDKTIYANVDTFIIYREITTNNYQRIGAVPYDSLSQFVDTVSTLYFPNTGDPNSGTYRYKLQAYDTCGNYSALGPYHNTIFMTNNNGTFSWPQLYTIENSANPVNAYVLERDDNSNGNWHAVNSVAGTQQSVTDPAYSSWQATANWRIQTSWAITCTPTMRYQNNATSAFSSSVSNTLNPVTTINEIALNNSFLISPNPSNGKFNLQVLDPNLNVSSIAIYNVFGEKIEQESVLQSSLNVIDLTKQPSGIYFVYINTDYGVSASKIIIQR